MAWFIGQSILMIAAAFLLGLLVGWLIWGRLLIHRTSTTVEAAPPAPPPPASTHDTTPAPDAAPVAAGDADETVVAAIPEPRTSPEDADAVEEAVGAEPAPAEAVSEAPAEPVSPEPVTPEPVIPEPEPAVASAEPEPSPVAVLAKPQGKRKPRKAAAVAPAEVEPDDLERIEGIGPAMSRALIAAGIRTYGQLAETDDNTLRDAIKAKGLKFAPSLVTWARQARLLADGDEEGFAELTRRLVAGRDEGRE